MEPITTLLADDHVFLCDMLADQLEAASMTVVAKAVDTASAIAAARRHRPNVAILDIDMPGPSVFDAVRHLRTEFPEMRFVLLSAHVSDHFVHQALDLDVAGYIRKTESLEDIVRAIGEVAAGRTYFSPEVRARIAMVHDRAGLHPSCARIETLTPRELEILGYLARGLAKKEIAELMNRSVKTVDQHCTNLMAKLEIHDRVQLARFAIREGLALP